MKFARYTNLFEKKAKRKFLYLSHSCVRDPKRYLRIGNLHHRSHWICISFQKASHRFLQNLFSSYSFPYPPSSPPPLQIYNDPASKVLGQTAGLSVFQLGCTISFLSLFFFFRRRLPVAGAKKRWRPVESILSPRLSARENSAPPLFAKPTNTRERPRVHCQTSIHPSSLPIFHKICIRGCAADSCFEFRDIPRLRMPEESSLSLSLFVEDTTDTWNNLCFQIPSPFLFPPLTGSEGWN